MGSPGPSTVSVTAVGAAFGLRRSLGYLSGLVAGTIAVLLAVPWLAPVLVAASVVYILYLAYRITTAPPRSGPDTAAALSFSGGVLWAVADPKAYVAITAVCAGSALDGVFKTAVLGVMIVLAHLVWLLAGVAFSRVFHDPVWSRRVNLAFTAALVATTVYAVM